MQITIGLPHRRHAGSAARRSRNTVAPRMVAVAHPGCFGVDGLRRFLVPDPHLGRKRVFFQRIHGPAQAALPEGCRQMRLRECQAKRARSFFLLGQEAGRRARSRKYIWKKQRSRSEGR
jgi:hypothetical protein